MTGNRCFIIKHQNNENIATLQKNVEKVTLLEKNIEELKQIINEQNNKFLDVKKPKNKKKKVPKALRKKVWERDIGQTIKGSCYVCDRILEFDQFEAGHIIAEANDG